MWKIISLSALLFVAQAAELHDFYGDWNQVAFYTVPTYVPTCLGLRYSFAKSTDNVQCSYDDGRNGTLLQVSIMTVTGDLMHSEKVVMRVVDTPAEVMPALNISVKCGDNVVSVIERYVARLVNENYFILYHNIPPSLEYTRTAVEQNFAILFGRNVVSEEKLYNDMMSIEDLKNRRVFCPTHLGTENNVGFKSTENEVGQSLLHSKLNTKANSVQVSMMTETGELLERYSMPMMVVDTPAEVMPALNIGCKCGKEEVNDHAVARLVDDNYFVMYHYVPPSTGATSTNKEQNAAYLFAKIIVSEPKLFDFMTSIEDLREREGAIMCAVENYGGPK